MRVTYYLAASLDGYIAETDGSVSWLDKLKIDQSDTGYEAFFDSVDSLVMGRGTYDFVLDHGNWPYGDKPSWVCASTPFTVLDGCNLQAATTPATVIKEAEAQGMKHLWLVGGGKLATSFVQAELLNYVSVSVMPIVLGEGIKVFEVLPEWISLRQEDSRQLGGFTQIEYSVGS